VLGLSRGALYTKLLVPVHMHVIIGAVLAHANQPIISGDHEKAVIRATAKQSKDSGAKISLMASQIGEAYDFCLPF
jgi:hypothetical protein